MKMRIFKNNKLWRDEAITMCENVGSKIHWIRLNDEEYKKQLFLQLLEETHEVLGTKSENELIVELADVLEVIYSIAKANNISFDKIIRAKEKKYQERGGFDGRKFVTKAEHPVGSFGEKYCLADPEKYPEIFE